MSTPFAVCEMLELRPRVIVTPPSALLALRDERAAKDVLASSVEGFTSRACCPKGLISCKWRHTLSEPQGKL